MKHKYTKFITYLAYIFLYVPMIVLVVYSFNESKMLTLWKGFSLKWYAEVLNDHELLLAVMESLKIASFSATFGVILGTCAGMVLSRMQFPTKKFFGFLSTLPLVMPEIIIGLSLLFLFETVSKLFNLSIALDAKTVIIAHTTFCMAYVTLMILVRLSEIDNSIEEAAQDLGATPFVVFYSITLPLIYPSVVSGWLLSFTLSMDDLILATFTSGPGTTTLPLIIYSRIKLGLNPEINVLGVYILIFVVFSSLIAYFLRKKYYEI